MNDLSDIRPMKDGYGVGFTSRNQLEGLSLPYREEKTEHGWNYHFTPDAWRWPVQAIAHITPITIDGFSPNLNKSLHIGHIRQLALANCLNRVYFDDAQFVSLLGTTGYLKSSMDELQEWFDFLDFHPKLYYDALMPQDADIVPRHDGEGDKAGALVWDGPNGSVVVFRKPDETGYRRSTYAFHDLAFAATVKPDFYITGVEQREHFLDLGLGEKHLPMGLVLDSTGKKLKSRTGDALTAKEAFDEVGAVMQPVPEPKKIIWNVVAWHLLATGRGTNVKFEPALWVKPEAPGMYCSYTWARLNSALGNVSAPINKDELTQGDLNLLGFSAYSEFFIAKTRKTMCGANLCYYMYELCRRVTKAYHAERIRDGRPCFRFAVRQCLGAITECMEALGLFPVVMREEV